MASFLSNRKQYVQVEGHKSEKLLVGPNSVIQGSTLSCALYLIYILDFPELFHQTKHEPEQYRSCTQTNLKTFIDDAYLRALKKPTMSLKETIQVTMDKVEDYTNANKLALNADKTQITLFTKDQDYKDNFCIELKGKNVKYQKEMKILGNLLSENLSWEVHVKKILIPTLQNKIRTLKLVNKYLGKGFKAIFTNSIFRSSLMFGLETWGGVAKSLISKIPKAAR